MKKQNIEDIFSSMENFSSVPPPELWGQIEEKLNKPKKKKRAILWWSAAACLLLGLMLPTVLHFNSDSGIKTIDNNTSSEKNNNVVIDETKTDIDNSKTKINKENDIQNSTDISNEKNAVVLEDSSDEETKNAVKPSQFNQNEKTTVTLNSKSKDTQKGVLNGKSNLEVAKTNQSVAEKPFAPKNDNGFNTISKNEKFNSEKRNSNQAVAEKTLTPNKGNSFNTDSKNQFSNTEKTNNQAVAEKSFTPNKENSFNIISKNQTPSFFEDKLKANNTNNIALSPFNSNLKKDQNADAIIKDSKIEFITNESTIANNPKSNSKFGDALSKQDSVQLAELQNLEKGIVTVTPEEIKKEKEDKAISKDEKWALEVFAGVANSENYKNDKTLGNVNDSKASNSYGVKTKYKINQKWAVSSGVKFNELGQSIANVSYMRTQNAFLSSSDYLNQNSTVAAAPITNNANYVFVPTNTVMALKSDNIESGKLDQSLRYLEVPLEVSYSIFNKSKTNISVNTGGFVGKLVSNNMALNGTSIGENVNANDYVYGSLLSTTVQYRIYKKTNIFVEPAMNYYINPLNEQSFNQFQWGLNFGLNVSF